MTSVTVCAMSGAAYDDRRRPPDLLPGSRSCGRAGDRARARPAVRQRDVVRDDRPARVPRVACDRRRPRSGTARRTRRAAPTCSTTSPSSWTASWTRSACASRDDLRALARRRDRRPLRLPLPEPGVAPRPRLGGRARQGGEPRAARAVDPRCRRTDRRGARPPTGAVVAAAAVDLSRCCGCARSGWRTSAGSGDR